MSDDCEFLNYLPHALEERERLEWVASLLYAAQIPARQLIAVLRARQAQLEAEERSAQVMQSIWKLIGSDQYKKFTTFYEDSWVVLPYTKEIVKILGK
jgi:hypothetical protein